MRIGWLPSAEIDTDSIIDHLDPINPIAARRIVTRIQQSVETLRPHPFIGPKGRAPETRELVIIKTPYIVIYSVEQDEVVVRRVLHTSQQWPPEDE